MEPDSQQAAPITSRPRICTEITDGWQRYFESQVRAKFKPSGNRASELGHPCEQYCLLARTNYADAPPPSPHVQGLFRQGNVMEHDTGLLLELMGLELRRADWALEWPQYQITGHIDREVKIGEDWLVCEIKGLNSYTFGAVNEVADLFTQKFWVFRKYPGQVLIYCLMHNTDRAVLLLRDKGSSDIKPLWVYLDEHWEYAESLIKRAERINAAIRDGVTHLDRLCDPAVCERCDFLTPCAPPLTFAPPLLSEDPHFIELLKIREESAIARATYDDAHDRVTDILKRTEWGESSTLYAGDYIIHRKPTKAGVRFTIQAPTGGDEGAESNG